MCGFKHSTQLVLFGFLQRCKMSLIAMAVKNSKYVFQNAILLIYHQYLSPHKNSYLKGLARVTG